MGLPDDRMPQKLVYNIAPRAHAAGPDSKWSDLLDTLTKTRAASIAGAVQAAPCCCHTCIGAQPSCLLALEIVEYSSIATYRAWRRAAADGSLHFKEARRASGCHAPIRWKAARISTHVVFMLPSDAALPLCQYVAGALLHHSKEPPIDLNPGCLMTTQGLPAAMRTAHQMAWSVTNPSCMNIYM